MTINETNPRDSHESGPSLHVVREVSGLPKDFNNSMRQEIRSRRTIDPFDVDILLEPDSYLTLISPEEILNFEDVLGEELTSSRIDSMVDFLITELSSKGPDKMTIEVRPLDKRYGKEPGDTELGQLKVVEYCIFRAPAHNRIQRERRIAKEALYDFFDIDAELFGLNNEDIWENPRESDIGHLVVANAIGISAIQKIDEILAKTRVLPLGITLGPLIVEKV
jgi:hypothetical protein